jgi:hypothetical protein
MTGVVGPVYASKRLFTRLDFQSDKGLESAKYRPIVEDMLSMHPENPIGSQMLDFIWQTTGR